MTTILSFQTSLPEITDERIAQLVHEHNDSRVGPTGYAISDINHPALYEVLESIVGVPKEVMSNEEEHEYICMWSAAYDLVGDIVKQEAARRELLIMEPQ